MNNPVLRLLFDYKGSINEKEYRNGLVILFFISLTFIISNIYSFLQVKIISLHGIDFYQKITYRNMIIDGLWPQILPLKFVLFYSSFILALKRVRSLGWGTWSFLFFGFSIYFLVTILSNSTTIIGFAFYDESYFTTGYIPIVSFLTLLLVFFISLPGTFIPAIIKTDNSQPGNSIFLSFSPSKKIDQKGYLQHLGIIIAISFGCMMALVFSFTALYKLGRLTDKMSLVHGLITIVLFLVFAVFYTLLNVRRLKDTKYPGYFFIIIILVYIIVQVFSIYLLYRVNNYKQYMIVSIVQKAFHLIFLASQYLIILLPSQE
ncbi:MAG: hypothetical protein JXB49_24845 [Bacteroidales bacterium]|nr:hypothetical protein [Bacteroidales bacterium]